MEALVAAVGCSLMMILAVGAVAWHAAPDRSRGGSGEAAAFGSQLAALCEDRSDAANNESSGRA